MEQGLARHGTGTWKTRNRDLEDTEQGLTSQRVHSNPGTHLLEMTSELSILPNFRLVVGGEQLQVFAERVQLLTHLCRRGGSEGWTEGRGWAGGVT